MRFKFFFKSDKKIIRNPKKGSPDNHARTDAFVKLKYLTVNLIRV